ncbi:MAG: folylpolyglutamate synthase/dihydrofolate synthase family protein [Bacteroidota bacterium]
MKSYAHTLEYLYKQLPMFHRIGKAAYKADLSNTISILDVLNNPQESFKSVHIAGTNGKGSTSHLIASIFKEAGYKTGLYTSPHLKDFRERIKINGEMIPENYVVSFVENYKIDFEKIAPSFFEWTVGLAFDYFRNEKVDIAIIETGLGGRLDSTNLIHPLVSVITNIGFDHTDLLGDTLEKIAFEKAGIIKENTPVVIGETIEQTKDVFAEKSKKEKSNIFFAEDEFEIDNFNQDFNSKTPLIKTKFLNKTTKEVLEIQCPLAGIYQLKNFRTVLQTFEVLKKVNIDIDKKHIEKGFENVITNTDLKGRWQILSTLPLVVADTAHNEHGIEQIILQLSKIKYKKLHLVLGFVKDKEVEKILKMFPQNASFYFAKPNIPRGMDVNEIKEIAARLNLNFNLFNSVSDALKSAKANAINNDLIYIGGSTFIVAEVV